MTDKDELAALKARVEELERAAKPPEPEKPFVPDPNWADKMHQLAEKRMSMATPPSVIRDWNVLDNATCQDLWRHGTVQSPSGAGTSGQVTRVSSNPGIPGSGWVEPRPLGPPPGIQHVDAQMIADEVRQRSELKRKLGE